MRGSDKLGLCNYNAYPYRPKKDLFLKFIYLFIIQNFFFTHLPNPVCPLEQNFNDFDKSGSLELPIG